MKTRLFFRTTITCLLLILIVGSLSLAFYSIDRASRLPHPTPVGPLLAYSFLMAISFGIAGLSSIRIHKLWNIRS